jgi:hypothetical protein
VTASTPERLPVITRPNGKPYQPRAVKAHAWGNDDAWESRSGAVVLGTHDVDRARLLAEEACNAWYGTAYAVKPEVDWFRSGFSNGERAWIRDDVRGAAGVMFTAADDPEETP